MLVIKTLKFLCLTATIFYTANISAIEDTGLPSPFLAEYDAFRYGKNIGTAELRLRALSENLYELHYSSKVSRFFLSDKRYETTLFSVPGGTLTPHSYIYTRKGTGTNKFLNVTFDYNSKKILIQGEESLDWDGEIDNQLFRIDISRQLAKGETIFAYKFLNYRGQKREYIIEVLDKEMLELPYGNIEAIKVQVNRDNQKRKTFAWFAPSLDLVLVRLQQFKEGEEQGDIRLKTFQEL